MDLNYRVSLILLPIIPLFLFSLITYKMRDEVYRAWLRLASIWIPLSMLGIFLAPEYSGQLLPLFPVTKSSVAFVSAILFGAISLLIIAWKYFKSLPKY